ncbi:hypothetical protein Ccrd_014823, partial [Cynara cardunculus var. scolymus]
MERIEVNIAILEKEVASTVAAVEAQQQKMMLQKLISMIGSEMELISENKWTPKATLEIKDMALDMSKDPGSKPSMYLKLQILPIVIHLGEQHVSCDSLSSLKGSQSLSTGDGSIIDKSSAHFICEEFGLLVEFGTH